MHILFTVVKVQYASDLHLEFPLNRQWLRENPIDPIGDVLLLAGDISLLEKYDNSNGMFDYFSENWDLTIIIPGNHEYYHNRNLDRINKASLNEYIRENVVLVNNQIIQYKDVNFMCTTLWSHIDAMAWETVTTQLNDFHLIRYGSDDRIKVLDANFYNFLHHTAKKFLDESLKMNKGQKNVVMTHHGPSKKINHPDYKGSLLNTGFIVEMDDYFYENDIDYWVYGHTHRNVDAEINSTKVVTNQLGYLDNGEGKGYSDSKFFTI